ncbi:LAMI_0H15984g1_1 [Lachancea mirantina]|uniref:LAMI_0H15984g1_1 n=1 Tax=Lachancea mirantina TaxID=1230905 RepID=A0A1G4KIP5_9SACH|nr:LAMI_0H15984g1_1 [Lachancea mirantina]
MDEHNFLEALDYDLDIDFETAYEMINNNGPEFFLEELHESGEGSKTSVGGIDSLIFEAAEQQHASAYDGIYENIENATSSKIHAEPEPGLLTHNEAHAIEQFLDSLIASGENQNKNFKANALDIRRRGGSVLNHAHEPHADELHTHVSHTHVSHTRVSHADESHADESHARAIKMLSTAEFADTGVHYETSQAFAKYNPPAYSFPEFTVLDSEVPSDIKNNHEKVRKWKHVQLEKKRRNAIKEGFDTLTGLLRFPRVSAEQSNQQGRKSDDRNKENSKETRSRNAREKRTPKYVLLSFIVEDIKLLEEANRELMEIATRSRSNPST